MKKNRFVYAMMALLGTLLLGACKEDPTPEPIDPPAPTPDAVVTLAGTTVEALAEGGEYTLAYTLENPVEGAEFDFACEADWVENLTADQEKILFTVTANELEEPRTATVTVAYGEIAQAAEFTITQAAKETAPALFTIEIEEVLGTSCITNVKALDPDMWYIMYITQVSYLTDYGITTAELLFEDEKSTYMRNAEFDGMNLGEYMETYQAIFKGDKRAQWSNLIPGTEMVFYVYGIEFNADRTDYTLISDVAYELITPKTADLVEGVTFDVDVTVSGPDATVSVTPNGWDEYYVIELLDHTNPVYLEQGAEIDEEYINELGKHWMDYCSMYKMYYGYTNQDICNEFCYSGAATETQELKSATDYCAVVYATKEVDGLLQLVSKPAIKHFSTEKVQQVDMTLDIRVDNIGSRIADVTVTPSLPNEQYLFLLMPADYILSTNEDDIIVELLNDFITYAYTFKGEMTSHVTTLYDNTPYSIFCFGYHGGVPTTGLFRYDFTTEAAEPGEIKVLDVVVGGPYDPAEVAAALPEYSDYATSSGWGYMVSYETTTDKPCDDIFHALWDYETYKFYMEYSPDSVASDLLAFYHEPLEIEYSDFGWENVVCSIAMDSKGNVSEMFVTDPFVFYDASEYKPVDELLEKLATSPKTSVMFVGKKNATKNLVYHKPAGEKITLKR